MAKGRIWWKVLVVVPPAKALVEHVGKNVFMDKVKQPRVGSVVYCSLGFGYADHSGIYVAKDSIVSLSDDDVIVKESPEEFLEGMTKGNTIYVSCKGKSPIGSPDAAKRARKMVGKRRDYNIILDNCHQFSSGCLTGNFENADNFLWMLKDKAKETLGADTFRAWDR